VAQFGRLLTTDYLAKIRSVAEPTSRITELSLRNEQATPLQLIIEPWASEIDLDPQVDYVVVAYNQAPGDAGPDVLIQWHEGGVALFAQLRRTVLAIFREGHERVW
jgi:hypothetical protein